MFGKNNKNAPIDIRSKQVKTKDGVKTVPTTKAEQRKLRSKIEKKDPNAVIIDDLRKKSASKNQNGWLDELAEIDAMLDD